MGWFTCGTTNNLKIKIGQSPKKDVTAKHPPLLATGLDCNGGIRTPIKNILHLSTQIHLPTTHPKMMTPRSYRVWKSEERRLKSRKLSLESRKPLWMWPRQKRE